MALKLKRDSDEHVIRSVGDPPNGILALSFVKGVATLSIDPTTQPSMVGEEPLEEGLTIVTTVNRTENGLPPGGEAITATEAVEACEGEEEARIIYFMVATGAHALYDSAIANGDPETIIATLFLVAEIRDRSAERFLPKPEEETD